MADDEIRQLDTFDVAQGWLRLALPAIVSMMRCVITALLLFPSIVAVAENTAPKFSTANPSFSGFDVRSAERFASWRSRASRKSIRTKSVMF